MLHLIYGNEGNKLKAQLSGEDYFDTWVDEEVIVSDFGKMVIGGIERGEVLSKRNIVIPVIGAIPPSELSGGTKTLLSLYFNNELFFDLSAMGDNCFRYLGMLTKDKDIKVCTDLYREMYENGFEGSIFVENTGVIISNKKEMFEEWCKYIDIS